MPSGYAIACGTLYSILMALSAWFLSFVATFPWENRTDGQSDDWLVLVAVVMFASAVAVFAGVMTGRARLVTGAFVAGAVTSIPALRYALVDWSDHGDEKLLAFAVLVGVSGLLAVVFSRRAARQPVGA